MPICYFGFGLTLATIVNVETIVRTPPHVLPERGGLPMPLMGGVARRPMSGRLRRSGRANGVWAFDVLSQSDLNALQRALFGDLVTAGRQLYVITLDTNGAYSPFRCDVDCFYIGQSQGLATGGWPVDVRVALSGGVLQTATKTSNATLTASERLIYVDTTSGNVTLTLMGASAVNADTPVRVVKTAAANTLSVQRGGTDTLNGGTSALTVTTQYGGLTLVSNGAGAWATI